ncbi:MAG: metallophosphoesterase [Gemmatimonadetes bacterium]|nr:metallophosphoesterase [Gemmatimonadota bacterium]
MRSSPLVGSALVLAAGVAAYATFIEPRWLQVVRRRIHIRRLPRSLEGLRIGLLSDLHAADGRSVSVARRAAELVMAEAPDVIAITGDFAEDEGGLRNVLGALDPLRAPLGVWAVPGNHDHTVGIETWRQLVHRAVAVHDLTNRFELVEHRGARICLGGVDDLYRGRPRLTLPPPEERDLTLLLAHTPDLAERCRRAFDAVDLVLSGHTHGGQVRLPFLPAPVNTARHRDLYENGLRRRPWTQVYTSRGIGTTGVPFRFFARPEVTLLTLTAERRPAR